MALLPRHDEAFARRRRPSVAALFAATLGSSSSTTTRSRVAAAVEERGALLRPTRHLRLGDRPELRRVHGDRAYIFRTYTERLATARTVPARSCVAGSSTFSGASPTPPGGSRLLMNSHSQPMEPIDVTSLRRRRPPPPSSAATTRSCASPTPASPSARRRRGPRVPRPRVPGARPPRRGGASRRRRRPARPGRDPLSRAPGPDPVGEGAHRDAAVEFGRLARNDPRQTTWTVAEAEERLGAAQPGMGVDAARRAVRLAPDNGRAQLALAQALARTGDARGAFQAATRAASCCPAIRPPARRWPMPSGWRRGRGCLRRVPGARRRARPAAPRRVVRKARTLYRQHAGWLGRLVAGSVRCSSSPSARLGRARPMKAGTLRRRLTAALGAAMRNREADAIALVAGSGRMATGVGARRRRRRCRDRAAPPRHADARRRDGAGATTRSTSGA